MGTILIVAEIQKGAIREASWRIAPVPEALRDRRVEITGPVERRIVVNALNSGAQVFLADFEDATAPTWKNLVEGQQNLFDAVRRTIDFVHGPTGKRYETSIFSDRALRRAAKDIPGVTTCRGGVLHVEDLGDVQLGHYVVEPELRTLTMLRVVLKSPPSGEIMAASVQGDGRPR